VPAEPGYDDQFNVRNTFLHIFFHCRLSLFYILIFLPFFFDFSFYFMEVENMHIKFSTSKI